MRPEPEKASSRDGVRCEAVELRRQQRLGLGRSRIETLVLDSEPADSLGKWRWISQRLPERLLVGLDGLVGEALVQDAPRGSSCCLKNICSVLLPIYGRTPFG